MSATADNPKGSKPSSSAPTKPSRVVRKGRKGTAGLIFSARAAVDVFLLAMLWPAAKATAAVAAAVPKAPAAELELELVPWFWPAETPVARSERVAVPTEKHSWATKPIVKAAAAARVVEAMFSGKGRRGKKWKRRLWGRESCRAT